MKKTNHSAVVVGAGFEGSSVAVLWKRKRYSV